MQRAYFELEQKVQERTIELSGLTRNLQQEIAERKTLQEEIADFAERERDPAQRDPPPGKE